ncbi:sulfotransferase domain-containing protein [Pelagibacterales bacterium SAG-MED06]|mgnify:FL=1|nr:sulfotransferase domain-containing protein [Pelagibacterales bacterium SAG-MED06]|tara:strand:- start:130 stop:984 length:855 start_codon:yes stop_codon:yes gene_type:complete
MIFWISSYPKSGNTWLRILLSSYYFTKDGFYDESVLKNIDQFPQKKFFDEFNYDPRVVTDTIKFWIKAQEKINQDKKLRFFKTHNAFGALNNFHFTNKNNSIGCVYVVRDPRNVITSLKNFYEMNDDQAFKWITNKNQYIYDVNKFEKDGYSDFQFISSWDTNFESWKVQKKIPIKIIRYEDLLNQTFKVVSEVITFINQTTDNNEKINKNKIKNVINSSSFSKLQDKEKNEGFSEAPKSKGGDKKIPFFNLGPKNNWKIILNDDLKDKLNNIFKKKLEELSYQ